MRPATIPPTRSAEEILRELPSRARLELRFAELAVRTHLHALGLPATGPIADLAAETWLAMEIAKLEVAAVELERFARAQAAGDVRCLA
jgi:hypothetical protein